MITLNFENFLKLTVQDGPTPIPKGKMEVTSLLADKQEAKGLIPSTTKFKEIM